MKCYCENLYYIYIILYIFLALLIHCKYFNHYTIGKKILLDETNFQITLAIEKNQITLFLKYNRT